MDDCARGTLRSSESEGGCFGGLRRRNEGYRGRKPVEASYFLVHTCLGPGEVMQSQQALSPKILGINLDVNRHFRMKRGGKRPLWIILIGHEAGKDGYSQGLA